MQTNIPSASSVLLSLLRADFITQWRNRRAVMMSFIIPMTILLSWKALVEKFGGPFVLSNSLTLGLTTIGMMGYSNSIARDRDKGIFQRLRVAPLSTWAIMVSRLAVQSVIITAMIIIVFVSGFYFDKIELKPLGYLLGFFTAFMGGTVFLSLGQAIVGLIKNAETVSSTSRLVYTAFILVGMLGELNVFPAYLNQMIKWSPYGTVVHILGSGMQPVNWNQQSSLALLATMGYAVIFTTGGIKWFSWDSR
jgi:ABC-2 type transport system permease protein